MFALCEATEWNHLPNQGGLFDQSPILLDDFYTIWEIKSKIEKQKQQKEERERKSAASRTPRRRR